MAIKGLLFDKDGTLIDDVGTWVPSYREILGELFPGEIEAKMAVIGYDAKNDRFISGSPVAGATTREIIAHWWPHYDEAALDERARHIDDTYKHVPLKHLKEMLPLDPLLSRFRAAGYTLGIGTNDTRHSTAAHVNRLGIGSHFAAVITADDVARAKPFGDMIERFAAAAGLKTSEVAMIGDNPQDMMAARNGGAGLAVAVLSGASAHDDIAHLADHVIDSIASLPELLEAL